MALQLNDIQDLFFRVKLLRKMFQTVLEIILTTSKVFHFCFAALASTLFIIWITIRQTPQISTSSPKQRKKQRNI